MTPGPRESEHRSNRCGRAPTVDAALRAPRRRRRSVLTLDRIKPGAARRLGSRTVSSEIPILSNSLRTPAMLARRPELDGNFHALRRRRPTRRVFRRHTTAELVERRGRIDFRICGTPFRASPCPLFWNVQFRIRVVASRVPVLSIRNPGRRKGRQYNLNDGTPPVNVPSLPRPVGRQREVLYLPANGHTVVLGTAGSGKTTLAILRSLYLADPSTDHGGQTLLVTFNRCLVTYMRHLAGAIRRQVIVENYHRFARGYLSSRGKLPWGSICKPQERLRFIRVALREARANGRRSSILHRAEEFFDEEFQWIQQHGITDEQSYVTARRIGRAMARVTRAGRVELFDLYTRYLAQRECSGKLYDWSDLASAVLDELSSDQEERRYRHVVIDEGQDFSPEMLRSLAAIIPGDGSLTFFGDIAQQIYGHRMSWRSAGLAAPQVWRFKENYRNTKQISRLALELAAMPNFPDDPDLVEPTAPVADGPLPALRHLSSEPEERQLVVSRAVEQARTGTVAVLFRTRDQERSFRRHLPDDATQLHRDLDSWPNGPGLFYGTYHAAKGLEFDTVFLPFLSDEHWPHPPDVQHLGDQEAAARSTRLLYVGITRARSALVLTYCGRMTSLLPRIKGLYQR